MLALAVAAAVAAAPLDPARVALRHALAGDVAAGCSATELNGIVKGAGMAALGALDGHVVVLASPHGSCICGNVNCPYLVLRVDPGGASRVLLNTYAYDVQPIGRAQPLPNLRELAHDSALISDETVDAYRNGTYAAVSSARIRGDNGTRKANAIPVRFATATSAATLAGHVSTGWYDEYTLSAAAGQRITIGGIHSPGPLTFSLLARKSGASMVLKAGVPAVLPVAGTYILHVDAESADDLAYRATVTIR